LTTVAAFALAALLFIIGTAYASGFASLSNVRTLAVFASVMGLVGLGETFVILTGGIDLSVAYLVDFGGIQLSYMTRTLQVGLWVDVLLVVAMGIAIGAVSGFLVAVTGAPPLVLTLGVGGLVEGYLVAVGTLQSAGDVVPPGIEHFTAGYLGPVPNMTLVWLGLAIVCALVLTRTTLGRRIYLVGTNPRAARLSGIHVNRVRFTTYMVSGATATIAGVLLSGFVQTSYIGMGSSYLFGSVAAVAIGGTALVGGTGSVWGTVGGACTLTILAFLLPILGLNSATVQIADGGIILVGVLLARRLQLLGRTGGR
jgi:ribose transport system permease protein